MGFSFASIDSIQCPAMRVRLLLFAVLRDITGKSEADLELPVGTRPRDVWQTLRAEHHQLAGYELPPMTAINESYASPDELLSEGDELAFIPPVAGG
jgi:molybdopterin converting factor subunit 1